MYYSSLCSLLYEPLLSGAAPCQAYMGRNNGGLPSHSVFYTLTGICAHTCAHQNKHKEIHKKICHHYHSHWTHQDVKMLNWLFTKPLPEIVIVQS